MSQVWAATVFKVNRCARCCYSSAYTTTSASCIRTVCYDVLVHCSGKQYRCLVLPDSKIERLHCGDVVGVFHWKPTDSDFYFVQKCENVVAISDAVTEDGHPAVPAAHYAALTDTYCLCAPHEIVEQQVVALNLAESGDSGFFPEGCWRPVHGDPSRGYKRPTFFVHKNKVFD